jgi:hypothetical protein
MPSLMPYRGSNNLPARNRPGSKPPVQQRRAAKPPLAVRTPGLIEGASVVGAALPGFGRGAIYAGLAVAACVWRASLPLLQFPLWGVPLLVWVTGGLVCIALYELVPFVWAILGFRLRRQAEAWERQQIHEAQTYGDARQASWDEADSALRGHAGGSRGAHQVFDE